MAVGDLLTGDYQWEVASTTLYGRSSNGVSLEYPQTIEGLGVPDAKTQDVVYNGADGSYANPDYVQLRVITIPALIRGSTASAAMTSFKALTLVWVPKTSDIDLAFQLPGWGKFKVRGRPRGIKADFKHMRQGAVHALLRFDCPNPTITYI